MNHLVKYSVAEELLVVQQQRIEPDEISAVVIDPGDTADLAIVVWSKYGLCFFSVCEYVTTAEAIVKFILEEVFVEELI
jgi:hypothetical protein